MKYDVESKLNTVSTQIDTLAMTEAEKHMVWRKIEAGMAARTFFLKNAGTRVRAGAVLFLTVLFAGSSVAFAYADTAQPGDILFPLGVAREKVEIFLAPASQKNNLRVKFAEKRIEDGQVFLSLMVKANGTYASTTAFAAASSTSTGSTGNTGTTTASTTTSRGATEDAVRHFNATIAYLSEVKADLLAHGDDAAAAAIQGAIDAMTAQAHEAPTKHSSVTVKAKDNPNKFKLDVRVSDGTTTTRTIVQEQEKTEKNESKDHEHGKSDERKEEKDGKKNTVITIIKETFVSTFFNKKEEDDDKKDHKKEDQRKERDEDEDEDEGFFEHFGKKASVCHVSGGQKKTISVGKSAVKAHLAHGDTLGKCDTNGTATTTPDTTAPVISNITVSTTTTAANLAWDTNESASYKLWYSTTSPLVLTGTPDKTGGANTHQSATLTGLSSETTYYYVIATTDASGNTSTSTELSFKTTAAPDTTAPNISDLSAALITSSNATVYWNTNESATGKVKYGTTTPLTNILENTALSLTHSFSLTSLSASTTYRYVVSSIDGAGNATTSGELIFTTL